MRKVFFWLLLRLTLPLAVLAGLCTPVYLHFDVDRSQTHPSVLLASRQVPDSPVLEEISGMSMGVGLDIPESKVVEVANQILAGYLPVPQFQNDALKLQGYPHDYQFGPPTLQLILASLEVENILLRAFEQTRDMRFLHLATRRIVAFASYEAAQRRNEWFLWNDHAVGARIPVLIRLWLHLRDRSGFSEESSREIVSLAERSGRLLAKADHFTVRTNHGVVQNVALLQIAAAFPGLPETIAWRQLALERLRLQLPFYLSREGVVLEHSSEYHLLGTELLALAVRLCVLNGLVPDPLLVDAERKSRLVLGVMIRPDGTLPVLGNTSAKTTNSIPVGDSGGSAPVQHLPPPHPAPTIGGHMFPLAGYAIWWLVDESKTLYQTLITWAKHDGHGHKHADEGSVLFWSDGVEWITNTGYWPYGARNEVGAYTWTGSNAAHQPGEAFSVARAVRLLATGETSGVRFIEIERRNKDGVQFRRQVVQIDARSLLVLDFALGAPQGTETIWTVDPALRLIPDLAGTNFVTDRSSNGRNLAISYAANTAAKLQVRRGSEQPFAGWVVVNNRPTPADALHVVNLSTNSASAVLFKVASDAMEVAQKITIEPGATADRWGVSISGSEGYMRLRRTDTILNVENLNSQVPAASLVMHLLPAPDIVLEKASLTNAYKKAIDVYPPWRDLTYYRVRLSYAVGILALLIEIGWFAVSVLGVGLNERRLQLAHLGLVACWAAMSVWIFWVYLR